MCPQPSCSKTNLTPPLSLWLLTIAVLTLLPGIKGVGAIAPSPNLPRSPVGLPQQIAQTTDAAKKVEADSLLYQAMYSSDISDEAKSKALQRALELYRQIKDRTGERGVLMLLSQDAESRLHDYRKAIDYQQQILVISRELKDRMDERAVLFRLADIYHKMGEYQKAIDYQQQILVISRELKDRTFEKVALLSLADDYYQVGEYQKAIDYQQQILVIDREQKDRVSEMAALSKIGDAYYRLGEYHKVIDYEQQILAIARELKTKPGQDPMTGRGPEQTALGALFNAYRALGDYPNATKYQQEMLALEQDIKKYVLTLNGNSPSTSSDRTTVQGGDKKAETDRLLEQGEKDLNPEAKIATLQQALEIYRQIKDREGEKNALLKLGNAYVSFGIYKSGNNQNHSFSLPQFQENINRAIDYQQQSLAIARELNDPSSVEYVLDHLAGTYIALSNVSYILGDYTKVIEAQQQRLIIVREQKSRFGESDALRSLGDGYYRLGEYAKAVDYEQQSLAIAQEIKNREGERAALLSLGSAYLAQGNFKKAIDYEQQSLIIAREVKSPESEGTALNELGVALEGDGRLPEAEHRFLEAITVWETLREKTQGGASESDGEQKKIALLDTQATTYRNLQRVLVAQNKINTALEIAERGRARAFVDLLSSRIQGEGVPRTVVPPISLTEIKQIAKAQNATLVEYSIIDEASGTFHDFAGIGLVEQKVHESALYIWVVQPTGAITFRKVDLKPLKQQNTTLEELVFNSRDSIGVRGLSIIGVVPRPGTQQKQEANSTEQLQQLHKLLIAPIADLLPADPNAHVIFLPQGSLFLAPFAALQDPQGKYLIEQHTIVIAPAIQVLELTHKQRQQVQKAARQQVLVVGNPKMPLQLPQLPGAEQEAKAIATLLHTQAIIGAEATKATIVQQMPNARWIHLATHGILDDQQGLASAIALAPNGTGEKTDGLLTADEILNLKLNAELVVLSACDTGRGRITGDGVIGLSRSLITAGVPSVLVSLWAVPDAPTASLMQGFYQQLQSNPDKAQALRQTMLSTMKQHPNPRDWAAFTLIGEAQ